VGHDATVAVIAFVVGRFVMSVVLVTGSRLLLFYQMQMKTPSQPIDIARVIHEAVTTDTPKLRYLVGKDAALLIAGRHRLTDEDYVATGHDMPDDQYLELMRHRYGFEW
jgi:hypothetical protein